MTVEDLDCITVADCKKGYCNILSGHQRILISKPSLFSDALFITLQTQNFDYLQSIYLEETKQPFGGSRLWLKCPDCDRRCNKLYWHQSLFSCRVCLGLSYRSRQSSFLNYQEHKALKIEHWLGEFCHYMTRPLSEQIPSRPKYMRKNTYQRLIVELNDCKSGIQSRNALI